MRVTALVFAVTMWYLVSGDSAGLVTRDMYVPIQYQGLPDGYSLSATIQNVEVKVEGGAPDMKRLDAAEIQAAVGMSDLKPGKYRLPVQVVPPNNVRLIGYSPNVVELEIYRTIERSFRPTLVTQGDMPANMAMSSVDIRPAEVSVKGQEASVLALRRAEARAQVSDLMSGERELPVTLMDDNGDVFNLKAEPTTVKVRAIFTETMKEARIPVKAGVTGVPARGFVVGDVVISPDFVTLKGTREALLGVTEININPIDVTGHTENMNVDIPLESPSDSIAIIGADHVNMRIELRASMESRTFLSVPVRLTGVSDPTKWTVSPPSASVSIERVSSGEPLDNETPPLELYVDATNVVTSQITLPILVRDARGGVNVIRIEPPQVTITSVGK
jgi:YbbR domain-containing protein